MSRATWNAVHAAHDKDALSDSKPAGVFRHHCLEPPHAGSVVLDIGVGTGGMARYLHGLGCTVDCLDIADEAARTVKPWARQFYLHDEIETLPNDTYDLAISHLVAQHMAEPDLRRQIREVTRALKPGGIFSLHLAGSRIEGENNWTRPDIPEGFDGRMCRDEEYAVAMIEDEVGDMAYAVRAGPIIEWPKFRSYWFFVGILRR